MGTGIMALEKDKEDWKDEMLRREADIEWKSDALSSIRENGSSTRRLEKELRHYTEASEARMVAVEKDMEARCDELKRSLLGVRQTIYGNGNGAGLTEKVRALASKWTTALIVVTFLATSAIGLVVRHYEKKALLSAITINVSKP